MTNRSKTILSITLLLLAIPVLAQRQALDDSLSPRRNFSLDLQWNAQEMGQAIAAMINNNAAALPPLTGHLTNVETRLDTRRYVGRHARIYLTVPVSYAGTHSPHNMLLSWKTRGLFIAGSARPGQSSLIFDGIIEQEVTGDVFDFTVAIEQGDVPDSFTLETDYEIEILP